MSLSTLLLTLTLLQPTPVGTALSVTSTPVQKPMAAAGMSPTPARKEPRRDSLPRSTEASRERPLWYDLALATISSFAGAAAAAWIVFRLQTRKERRERRDEEIRELRRIQFALIRRLALLEDLWKQWLGPAKKKFGGHWGGLQSPVGFSDPPPLALERLGFVIQTDANLLGRLDLIEQRFQAFLTTVNRYSKWREDASARIEERDREDGSPHGDTVKFSNAQVEAMAGHRLHHQLDALAGALYNMHGPLRADLLTMFDEVGEHIVSRYKGKRLRVEAPIPPTPDDGDVQHGRR